MSVARLDDLGYCCGGEKLSYETNLYNGPLQHMGPTKCEREVGGGALHKTWLILLFFREGQLMDLCLL